MTTAGLLYVLLYSPSCHRQQRCDGAAFANVQHEKSLTTRKLENMIRLTLKVLSIEQAGISWLLDKVRCEVVSVFKSCRNPKKRSVKKIKCGMYLELENSVKGLF